MEVQFYLVWPLLLLGLLRRGASRRVIMLVPVALFVASSVERAVMAVHHMQWNRLYLGSDTRSTALWVGCIVGLLHAWGSFDRSRALRRVTRALVLPAAGVLAVLVSDGRMNIALRPYVWGITVMAICAGVLVAAAASCRGGPLRPVLEARPVVWLGRVSYSVYLWHVPLIAELHRLRPAMGTGPKVAIILPASLVAGWISYVVVERPLLSRAGRARLRARLGGSSATVG
jgi:peptidoglycan/LPS O-acetylase OafA/YrhL